MLDEDRRVKLSPLWIDHPTNQPVVWPASGIFHKDRHDLVAWRSRRWIPKFSLHVALHGILAEGDQLLPPAPFRYRDVISGRVSSSGSYMTIADWLRSLPSGTLIRINTGTVWRKLIYGWWRVPELNSCNFALSMDLAERSPELLAELEVLAMGLSDV